MSNTVSCYFFLFYISETRYFLDISFPFFIFHFISYSSFLTFISLSISISIFLAYFFPFTFLFLFVYFPFSFQLFPFSLQLFLFPFPFPFRLFPFPSRFSFPLYPFPLFPFLLFPFQLPFLLPHFIILLFFCIHQRQCQRTSTCRNFTIDVEKNICYLKSSKGRSVRTGMTSGLISGDLI